MGNGYPRVADDEFWLRDKLVEIQRRLAELESMDGSQIYNTVQDLKNLVAGLLNQVDGNFTGNLTVAGNSNLAGNIDSLATYSRLVTGSGSFRAMSVNILGNIGQTVSSRRYKQDIETAHIPNETLRALRLVFFRYIAQVPFAQDAQPRMLGLIAEEVDELGLDWLVSYDEEGKPEALVDFALPFLGLLLAQQNAEEIDSLKEQLSALTA